MKRKLLIAVPILVLVALIAWWVRPRHEFLGEAYISERSVNLLSSIAQVRQQIGTLHYGDRVDTLARRNEFVKVRTPAGEVGWIEARYLMDPALWSRSEALLKQVTGLPIQAKGRTKVATNLRVEPGRTAPRLYQFGRGVPLEVVGRASADWVQNSDEKDQSAPQETKKEDWFLVRGTATRPPGESAARAGLPVTTEPGDQSIPIAGWVIARFLDLDVPDAVRTGASAANLRPVAWFELNRVPDESGEKPQYLLAAARGAEGQPCDFTNLRVFTWNARKSRYETAFIENDLCGQLPIRLAKGPKGEPEFIFRVLDGSREERTYRLIQTVVRRIYEDGGVGKSPARPAAKRKATR